MLHDVVQLDEVRRRGSAALTDLIHSSTPQIVSLIMTQRGMGQSEHL